MMDAATAKDLAATEATVAYLPCFHHHCPHPTLCTIVRQLCFESRCSIITYTPHLHLQHSVHALLLLQIGCYDYGHGIFRSSVALMHLFFHMLLPLRNVRHVVYELY